MKTAVDTSLLYAIFKNEPNASSLMDSLIQARREGPLLICEIVYAELSPFFQKQTRLDQTLKKMGIQPDPISPDSAWLAGQAFAQYRKAGGPRQHLIPDFLIAAHASLQADRLAAIDRGYYRRSFPRLSLLKIG